MNSKLKTAIVLLGLIALLIIAIVAFKYYRPTHFAFNDRFIIGNDYMSIQEKYGKFSRAEYSENGKIFRAAYFLRKKDLSFSYFYIILFDDNGIAYEVKVDGRDWAYNQRG